MKTLFFDTRRAFKKRSSDNAAVRSTDNAAESLASDDEVMNKDDGIISRMLESI